MEAEEAEEGALFRRCRNKEIRSTKLEARKRRSLAEPQRTQRKERKASGILLDRINRIYKIEASSLKMGVGTRRRMKQA